MNQEIYQKFTDEIQSISKERSEKERMALIDKALTELKESLLNVIVKEANVEVKNLDEINARLHKELKPIADALKNLVPDMSKQFSGIKDELSSLNSLQLSNFDNLPKWIMYILHTWFSYINKGRNEGLEEHKNIASEVMTRLMPEMKKALQEKLNVSIPKPEVTVNVPDVKVPTPQVTVEAPVVNIPEQSIDIDLGSVIKALDPLKVLSNNPNKPLSVRLSDGNNFIKLISEIQKLIKSTDETNKQVVAYSSMPSEITVDSLNNPVRMYDSYKTFGDGRKTVTSEGTRVQLSSTSVPCKKVVITGIETNTDTVVVGASTVVAAAATRRGTPLVALHSDVFYVDNLNKLYIDSVVAGEGITYVYYN